MEPALKIRVLLILAIVAIQFNYVLATRLPEGGFEPKLPVDVFPLRVAWVVPYVLTYPLWVFSAVWLVWKMPEPHFRAAAAGLFLACSLGISTFFLFPTYVIDPALPGNDLFSRTLRLVQRLDGDYAALPSAHVYVTTSLALFFSRAYPKSRWLWLFVVMTISLSALFTKQHYLLDVAGGFFTAWLGYRFGVWWDAHQLKRMRLRQTHA